MLCNCLVCWRFLAAVLWASRIRHISAGQPKRLHLKHSHSEKKKVTLETSGSFEIFTEHISSDTMSLSLSSLLSSAVSLLLAYQLRVCQPPPEVPNAVMLMEDGELEIGEFAVWLQCLLTCQFDGGSKLGSYNFTVSDTRTNIVLSREIKKDFSSKKWQTLLPASFKEWLLCCLL